MGIWIWESRGIALLLCCIGYRRRAGRVFASVAEPLSSPGTVFLPLHLSGMAIFIFFPFKEARNTPCLPDPKAKPAVLLRAGDRAARHTGSCGESGHCWRRRDRGIPGTDPHECFPLPPMRCEPWPCPELCFSTRTPLPPALRSSARWPPTWAEPIPGMRATSTRCAT